MAEITPLGTRCTDARFPGRPLYFCEPGVAPSSDARFLGDASGGMRCAICGDAAANGLWYAKRKAGSDELVICAGCGPEVYPHAVEYRMPEVGMVTAKYRALPAPAPPASLPAFSLVVRGPTWKWGDQDGHPGALGWSTKAFDPSTKWCATRWHLGDSNNYRLQGPSVCDIIPIVLSPSCSASGMTPGASGPPAPVRAARPAAAAAAAAASGAGAGSPAYPHSVTYRVSGRGPEFTVRYRRLAQPSGSDPLPAGTTVVRGPSWTWKDQDGSAGSPGWLVEDKPMGDGWATVLWHHSGTRNGYRMTAEHLDLTPVDIEPGPAAEAIRLASRGVAIVRAKAAAPPPSSRPPPPAAGAAGAAGLAAGEAIAILRAEKGSLEDEIRRLGRARKDVEMERDSAIASCDVLRTRVAELEARPAPAAPAAQPGLGLCIVCCEEPANIAFVPCGHMCCCLEHASGQGMATCPICVTPVTGRLRVYPAGEAE